MKACKKCELLSYLGLFNHARVGRALHRLNDVSTRAKQLDHFIQLNEEARSDIDRFIEPWNRA